jgi:hypothetical protein
MKRMLQTVTVALAVMFLMSGCGKTRVVSLGVEGGTGRMIIHFDHFIGNQPLVLNGAAYAGVDGAGNAFSVGALSYFVSNIQLRNVDGSQYGLHGYHFRDAANPNTRDYTLTSVPSGTYSHLVFTFGVDEELNNEHGAIVHDPIATNMLWPSEWGGGVHYMILEGGYDATNGFAYRTRTGRRYIALPNDPSGEGPDPVAYPHFFQVVMTFPSLITIDADEWETTVRMDLNAWYRDPNFDLSAHFPGGSGSIMLDLDAQDLLRQNGPASFTTSTPIHH